MADEIHRSLGRIEGKVESIGDNVEEIKRDLESFERRLRKLEAKQHWYSGVGAGLGMIAGLFFGRHS